jgi:hypothetical protein
MKRILTLLLVLGATAACGDDDDEGRPRYRIDIDAPTGSEVSDLPERDLDRICESFDVYVDTNISFDAIAYIACLPQAIVLSLGDPDSCQQQLESCTDRFPKPVEVEAQVRNRTVCYSTLRECRASVTALEGCVNVNLDLALDILDNWTCRGAADDDLRDRAERAMDTVSVCADLDAACTRFANPGPD